MDCTEVSGRIAAFLDGELAPGDVERFATHIEKCESCAQRVMKLDAQRFQPLCSQEREAICGTDGFWSDMDSALSSHMDQMVVTRASCGGPWHRRRVGMPMAAIVAYAAAMMLVVAWGIQQQERAQTAEIASEHLGQQLEQERRIAAQPSNRPRTGDRRAYKVVTYTPERGTF